MPKKSKEIFGLSSQKFPNREKSQKMSILPSFEELKLFNSEVLKFHRIKNSLVKEKLFLHWKATRITEKEKKCQSNVSFGWRV